MIKCEIILNGYVYDATNDLVNWDDVEMKWKRNDFDGVVRSFTTKFEFAGSTYSLLVSEFIKNMLNASASIVFYTRNNSWLWNERFRCALDFSTFSYNGNTCEINAIDDTLAAKIKANRSTKYEYNVSELSEKDLDYDRLDFFNIVKWKIMTSIKSSQGSIDDESHYLLPVAAGTNFYFLPFYYTDVDVMRNKIEMSDNSILYYSGAGIETKDPTPIFKNISGKTISINISYTFKVSSLGWGYGTNHSGEEIVLRFNIRRDYDVVYTGSITLINNDGVYNEFNGTANIDLPNNSTISLYFEDSWSGDNDRILGHYLIFETEPSSIIIDFIESEDSVKIPTISPTKLLNRLLKSINSDSDGITGEIVNPSYSLQRAFILPSESIRGISGAKIYTSYKDFQEWMFTVFGFVPVIGENKVSFVHMDTLFPDKQIKTLENVSEFEVSLDSGMVYTSVRVGYNKQDYDSVNGRDEFRFTTEYTTGTKLTDSSLELISPYRADAYGVEFLAQTRGEDTTDNSSDKDVFFIMVQSTDESVLHLGRGQTITGVISPETMFNNLYAAPYMITAHYNYLRTLGEKLVFTSSDGNSDVKINSFALNADLELPNTSLFLPARATFITDDSSIPDDLSGYISFVHQGKQYKGYVSEITLNIGRQESLKYELIVKSIEDA